MAQSSSPARPAAHPAAAPHESEEERKARAAAEEAKAREDAAELSKDLPKQGSPRRPPLSPEEAAEPGEAMVPMTFPHPVMLTLPGFRMVQFAAGPQEVPARLAEHPYLAANGVKRATRH